MAYSRGRDFMFCDLCGTMLVMKSARYAECPSCQFRRKAKDILGREISYTVTAEDIKRELGISQISEEKVELSKIKKKCEKCGNDEASYYTRQMRSADEGQTTFYTCTKCLHQFQDN
ncbi:hypothetical protein CsatB_013674 [Cannabis sativa]|nr:DNA-directed RNA polymerase I subunit RPA12 [Cannabis sativa]